MADIKLTYFNVRARAETARFILAHAGVRYTDQRLTSEQFSSVKPKIPFGQVPTLKYNGEVLCQSIAISRFLANEFGLAGKNNIENAQANEVVDAVNDLFEVRVNIFKETDEEKKTELRSKFLQDTLPNGLAKLENQLINRGGQYFVGNNLTWADFHVYTFLDMIRRKHSEELEKNSQNQELDGKNRRAAKYFKVVE